MKFNNLTEAKEFLDYFVITPDEPIILNIWTMEDLPERVGMPDEMKDQLFDTLDKFLDDSSEANQFIREQADEMMESISPFKDGPGYYTNIEDEYTRVFPGQNILNTSTNYIDFMEKNNVRLIVLENGNSIEFATQEMIYGRSDE